MAGRACIDDEALLELARGELSGSALEQVELHLRDCADCRAVLAEAARTLESSGREGQSGAPTHIARYQVVSPLGAGASGVVYRGFDPQLKRTVALKVLRRELCGAGPEQSQRMLREAQAMARLSDPHVVAVYDVGLYQGSVYVVMEYVDGATLAAWLRDARPSRPEILRVFQEAGLGLIAAHHKGLVHRDFKPENVLVAHDGRARVTDFGLARESENWLEARAADDQASTELYAPTRGLVGTPAYMAPELFEGGRASPHSDQFAFCVALFVGLFEKHPFKAGEGIALSELITRVRGHILQVPSFESSADERLFAVLARGLSADPAARYPELAALLSALTSALRGNRRRQLAWGAALTVAIGAPLAWLAGHDSEQRHEARPGATAGLAPGVTTKVEPAVEAPLPTAAPPPFPSASAPPRGPAQPPKRRPERKPGDVRYKDWLKEPF